MHPEHTSVGDFGQHLEIELKGFGAVSHQGFLNQVIGFLLRVLLVVGLLVLDEYVHRCCHVLHPAVSLRPCVAESVVSEPRRPDVGSPSAGWPSSLLGHGGASHNKRIAAARTDVGIGIGTQKQRSSTVGRRYSDGGAKLHSAPAGNTRRRFWASES